MILAIIIAIVILVITLTIFYVVKYVSPYERKMLLMRITGQKITTPKSPFYLGCYGDNENNKIFSIMNPNKTTTKGCMDFADAKGAKIFALRNASNGLSECWYSLSPTAMEDYKKYQINGDKCKMFDKYWSVGNDNFSNAVFSIL